MSKYALIVLYLKDFEQTLDDNHEVWITFPEYGGPFFLKSTINGGNEFIAFELLTENNTRLTVLQNYSQLNFALLSKLKADAKIPARK